MKKQTKLTITTRTTTKNDLYTNYMINIVNTISVKILRFIINIIFMSMIRYMNSVPGFVKC